VACSPVLDFHEVQDVAAAADEEQLHEGVVEGDPFSKDEVKVSCYEDDRVENLCFERKT
jgi:hypothetical protein